MKPKKIFIIFSLISFALLALQPFTTVLAAGSNLYLSPSSKTLNKGVSFSVQLRANLSSSDSFSSGIIAQLSFPKNLLSVSSLSDSGNSFTQSTSQSYDNSNGTISVYQAFSRNQTAGNKLVTTITFHTSNYGKAIVGFDYVYIGSSSSGTGGTYTVKAPTPPPPPPPPPSSPPPSSPPPTSAPPTSPPATSSPKASSISPTKSPAKKTPQPKKSSSKSKSTPASGDVVISDVTTSNHYSTAQIKWKSDLASRFIFSYGSDPDNLKASKQTAKLAKDGQEKLSDLTPGTVYYYQISAATSNKKSGTYRDQFTTDGFPVVIHVLNSNQQPIPSAVVSIGEKNYRTDTQGLIKTELPAGNFQATISAKNASKDVSFRVVAKPIPKDANKKPAQQDFTFKLKLNSPPWLLLGVIATSLIAGLGLLVLFIKRRQANGGDADLPLTAGLFLQQSNQKSHSPPVAKPVAATAAPAADPTKTAPTPKLSPPAPAQVPAPTPKRHNSVYLDEDEPKDIYELAEEKHRRQG